MIDCPFLDVNCCLALSEKLGWRVGMKSERVCERCQAEGGDPHKRADIHRRYVGFLKGRILGANKHLWDKYTGATGLNASAKKWKDLTGSKTKDLLALLDRAVKDYGLPSARADACIDAVEAADRINAK